MRRSPAERFIQSRLLEGVGVLDLQRELVDRQLDVLPRGRLDAYAAALAVPQGFDPRDLSHRASQRFLLEQGLRQYFHPDQDMRAAMWLLDQPQPREFTEVLVVSGADDDWLACALARRGTPFSSRALWLYRRFFFDLSLVDHAHLLAFLCRRRGEEVEVTTDDAYQRAARSRETSLGFLLELLRAGSMPSVAQLGRILRAAQFTAIAATLDAGLQNDSRKALQCSAIAKNVTEIIERIGDPSGDLQHELRSLLLETDPARVPHVSELGGTHTTNLLGEPTKH